MPELPEVETVRSYLDSKIRDCKINKITVFHSKIFKNLRPEDLLNLTIVNVERIAKYLVIRLSNGYSILSHLRMEGKYFLEETSKKTVSTHPMFIINLNNNFKLTYDDVRKFGTIHLYRNEDLLISREISKLGPEPLTKDFNTSYLFKKLAKSNKHIKTTLLDQTIISGIGNIYADEILFCAKINPLKKANQLNEEETKRIVSCTNKVIKLAIEKKGSSIDTYKYDGINRGQYQNYLKVHTKKGFSCYSCKDGKIIKTKCNGRGTYYCEICQI